MNGLLDAMFLDAFLTGLLLAPLAAALGCWLRLRGEWLSSLAYAQLAGAGGVLGAVFHWPVMAGAVAAALLGGGLKGMLQHTGNQVFGFMILLGWCVTLLVAANHPAADLAGRMFLDGQILFVGRTQLWASVGLAALVLTIMPLLSRHLLRQRLQPAHYDAHRQGLRPFMLLFDLLVVLAVALCALVMGVMASFALVMLPAWLVWSLASHWRAAWLMAAALALLAYCAAFYLSLVLDQPFGPVLVAVLLCLLPLRLLGRHGRASGGQRGDL